MVRRIGYITLLLALCLSVLILPPQPAAADPAPGDACSAGQAANSFQWSGSAGVNDAIFCIGGVWTGIVNLQSSNGRVGIGNTAPGSLLDVGKAGTTLGTMRLEGSTSGYVQLQTNVAAGSWNMTLPTAAGTSGYVLSTDGTGITSWISNAGTASTALSGITAATAGNTIANANNAQVWNWDTLAGASALKLGSTSTAAAGNAQKMLEIALSGANATAAQQTYGAYISNSHTGTTSVNEGLYVTVSGGASGNYAIQADSSGTNGGDAGVWGHALGATGGTYGVYGVADSTSGKGVFGTALAATGTTYGVYGRDASATGFGGYFTNTNGGYALATGSGNVGIGTMTPAQALEVNGQVQIDTYAAASATTVCKNANVLSTCSSSIRYKERVKDAPFGLKDVMLMRPVTFKWKGRDEKDLGFIAEEMEKVNPLFVNYERGQIEGVKYPQLTAVLANAVKEQQTQIKQQQAEIEGLKAANGKLEARLNALEAARH